MEKLLALAGTCGCGEARGTSLWHLRLWRRSCGIRCGVAPVAVALSCGTRKAVAPELRRHLVSQKIKGDAVAIRREERH